MLPHFLIANSIILSVISSVNFSISTYLNAQPSSKTARAQIFKYSLSVIISLGTYSNANPFCLTASSQISNVILSLGTYFNAKPCNLIISSVIYSSGKKNKNSLLDLIDSL